MERFCKGIIKRGILTGIASEVKEEITKQLEQLNLPREGSGKEFITDKSIEAEYRPDWFVDPELCPAPAITPQEGIWRVICTVTSLSPALPESKGIHRSWQIFLHRYCLTIKTFTT